MFGFVFKSKVLGVLEHELGFKMSVQSLKTIYKEPLEEVSRAVKKKGGNEYDAAFTFLFYAIDKAFPIDISELELKNIIMMGYLKHSSKTVFEEIHEQSWKEFSKQYIND